MAAKGTGVDAAYTYSKAEGNSAPNQVDASGKVINYKNSINPTTRKVTQTNINDLHLDQLKYDKNGNATLGTLTNKYHQ
jgi:hypothetical protein